MCTGGSSFPWQGLPHACRKPFWSLRSHSRAKYTSQKIKAPARGACREGRTRLKVNILAQDPSKRSLPGRPRNTYLKRCLGASCAPAGPGERQASGPGKITTPARCLPGRPTLCTRAPAHRPTRRPGAYPGTRGGWLCSLGYTVALHGDGSIAVADGDARAGAFGVDGDGH